MVRVVELPCECRSRFIAYKLNNRIEVIDSDVDFDKLLERLRRRGIDPWHVLIDYVPSEGIVYL